MVSHSNPHGISLRAWIVRWCVYGARRAHERASHLRARTPDEAARSVQNTYPSAQIIEVTRA